MNKKQFINVTLAALFACPISSVANTYSFYPVDEVPIVVHGPHRLFQYTPVVKVEYDNHNGTVGIRFCQTLMNVSVLIYKNGVGTMNYGTPKEWCSMSFPQERWLLLTIWIKSTRRTQYSP